MDKRKDFGAATDGFYESLDGGLGPLGAELRGVIRKALPGATETIKWGMPVYECDRIVCAVRPAKGYLALQLYTGAADLPDPDGLLEGTGKTMRHVKIRSKADIKKKQFTSWLRKAAGVS